MLNICALASGSNGNCYYIGNDKDAVLIDAGLSAKQLIMRINDTGFRPENIRAIFVTHEHTDHSSGARVLGNKLNIPVWLTEGTLNALRITNRPMNPSIIKPGRSIKINGFTVHPFLKNHDAAEPCSFRLEYDGWNIGVFTDIGEACDNLKKNLKLCHAVFIETNYDEKLLWDGSYPYILKRRVASAHGHLSNKQAFELIRDHSGPELLHVILSHLSGENNKPELASSEFDSLKDRFRVSIASRNEASEMFKLY